MNTNQTIPFDDKPLWRRSRINLVHVGLLALILALIGLGAVYTERFASTSNMLNVARAAVVPLLIGIGQTVVVLTAAIDLSIGSVISLSGVLTAVLAEQDATQLWWVIPVVMVICMSVGLINGLIVTQLKVHPIICTLGTSAIIQGCALLIAPVPKLGPYQLENLAFEDTLGIPNGTWLALALFAVTLLVLRKFPIGARIYAVGGDEHAARIMGINTTYIVCIAFVFSAGCAGFAGIYMVGLLGSGSPIMGQGYELTSIAPVVLGGTLLAGGSGGVGGTLLAVFFMALLNSLLNFLQVSTFYQWVIQGVIILVAVSTFSHRKRA
ncbi:ABC transporter permease [Ruegeria lacuscaerulensis]|uniref:ABC transporter permease n=1 Tax=Ruegeria lacuscaerulensis TaxID=55218 RepID=UPI00147C4276|nr:ABC transporter permease [Ruegeria lacuscaerulensis]